LNTPDFAWEGHLFALARQPLQDQEPTVLVKVNRETLSQAYAHCSAITRLHSATFHMASALLPPAKRRAVRALYAFCRVSDDLVDLADGDPVPRLEAWRACSLSPHPDTADPVSLAWADARARYCIPARYAHQLIDGVAKDIRVRRYNTFGDLAEYAYGVASTVGLMSMHIIGFQGPEAIPYAVKLGVALQLTNILRDVGEDWRNGRLYLPSDELSSFGLSENDIAAGRMDERWLAFMRFQIDRNRRLYREAIPGIAMLHPDGRFAIAAAAELYRAILDDIEAHSGDVFGRRAHVTRRNKLRRLPGIWWRAQNGYTVPTVRCDGR
jgi:phytoene synthase